MYTFGIIQNLFRRVQFDGIRCVVKIGGNRDIIEALNVCRVLAAKRCCFKLM